MPDKINAGKCTKPGGSHVYYSMTYIRTLAWGFLAAVFFLAAVLLLLAAVKGSLILGAFAVLLVMFGVWFAVRAYGNLPFVVAQRRQYLAAVAQLKAEVRERDAKGQTQ